MINPLSVVFVSCYLYNKNKSNNVYLSLGYAYTATALIFIFGITFSIGIIAFVLEDPKLFDDYALYGGDDGVLVAYIVIMLLELFYFQVLHSHDKIISKYQSMDWVVENQGTLFLTPMIVLGFGTLLLTFLI